MISIAVSNLNFFSVARPPCTCHFCSEKPLYHRPQVCMLNQVCNWLPWLNKDGVSLVRLRWPWLHNRTWLSYDNNFNCWPLLKSFIILLNGFIMQGRQLLIMQFVNGVADKRSAPLNFDRFTVPLSNYISFVLKTSRVNYLTASFLFLISFLTFYCEIPVSVGVPSFCLDKSSSTKC